MVNAHGLYGDVVVLGEEAVGSPEELRGFMPEGPGPYTAVEVAKALGWTPALVHEHCRRGLIASIGEHRSRRISRAATISYLRTQGR